MQIEQDQPTIVNPNQKKGPKTATIIAVLIIVTIVAVIVIIFAILSMQGKKLTVSVDGVQVSVPDDTFIFTEDR